MTTTNILYYVAPEEEIFEDMKSNAIEIWRTYDDEFGYATDKIDRIKYIKNIKDNFMYILAMFDPNNQRRLFLKLQDETKREVFERLI